MTDLALTLPRLGKRTRTRRKRRRPPGPPPWARLGWMTILLVLMLGGSLAGSPGCLTMACGIAVILADEVGEWLADPPRGPSGPMTVLATVLIVAGGIVSLGS